MFLPHLVAGEYESILPLIDVPKTMGGTYTQVAADPQSQHGQP